MIFVRYNLLLFGNPLRLFFKLAVKDRVRVSDGDRDRDSVGCIVVLLGVD